jgi:hypothetical protein
MELFTLESGHKMDLGMVRESRCGQTVPNMRGIGKMIWLMGKEY